MDDDEDFDWEAAVKEIDWACLASSKPSTSAPIYNNNKPVFSSKQSTLDNFVLKSVPKDHINVQNGGFNGVLNKPEPAKTTWFYPGQATPDDFVQKSVPIIDHNVAVSDVQIDPEAAQTWIYPVNVPVRDYQLSITRTALFSNTLVALPTGLGKTLIAAVVMYNYFRWFPKGSSLFALVEAGHDEFAICYLEPGKIIFAAPSRPLVLQQIEACHNIVGIPQDWTIDMTGQVNPSTRMHLWKSKRVFFVTPQVLENDIRSGTCSVKDLVCLVIDEAHRASGNYSYCVVVRELMDATVQLRILALTATPGSKQQAVQQVINNLQISTLEYRTESDPDVSPYVHDRKIELIEVAVGKDADQIYNILMEVARPFVSRLSTMRVLSNRDFKTLSPCDFLNARDRFHKAPPLDLPQLRYGEVEGLLGVLITLYHILKLLSSHGIRPAYEMLVEKLKQGAFARQMSRNESVGKAKLLMHQSLSRGAPSPKLSKMLEVLIGHFKTKDPVNSRVIIFSNFRESVRDIMDALATIGECVKATQFIGQSSAKTLKGQSQKAQQAVLEKFRAGGYNVIVATSIGEEGLDIMEVDLVICFDANISPLRMIQRMGRTGRKNDGRVVVLACEGSELKGYKRKQASSNSIQKHLRNGGIHSFDFHSSPRMIPHIFKPEPKLVTLSVEQFVSRGRKMKDDHPIESPSYKTKLTKDESDLITMYFDSANESTKWRPSLIAFPHFQAFPSRVHEVKHSIRTGMLIDTMQSLQGLSFSRDSETLDREDDEMFNLDLRGTTTLQQENCIKEECLFEEAPNCDPSMTENTTTVAKKHSRSCHDQNPPIHSFLFGSNLLSLDSVGRVMVLSVPQLSLKEVSNVEGSKNYLQLKSWRKDNDETSRVKQVPEFMSGSPTRCAHPKNDTNLLSADYTCSDLKDVELSPRLSNYMQIGVVPESPVDCAGSPTDNERGIMEVQDLGSPCKSIIEALPKSSSVPEQTDKSGTKILPASADTDEVQTPVLNNIKRKSARASVVSPVVEQFQNPLEDSLSNSKGWSVSPGDELGSIQQERKLKRLRKYGDHPKLRGPEVKKGKFGHNSNKAQTTGRSTSVFVENGVGKRKRRKDANAFIEEEAEVSSEVEVSDDEENVQEINSSYEDSFIDDKIDPTATTSTQAETSPCDMMAIYRRSLLSQSPMEGLSNRGKGRTPDSVAPCSRTSESVTPSGTMTSHSLHTPDHVPETENKDKISSQVLPCRESGIHKENENGNWKQKQKLGTYQVPAVNLEKFFSAESVSRETYQCEKVDTVQRIEANGDMFGDDDDKFFEGLDLDAVEEQATKLLEQRLESSVPKRIIISDPNMSQSGLNDAPSFDLKF